MSAEELSNSSSARSLSSDSMSETEEVVGKEGEDKVQEKQTMYDITKREVALIEKRK